MKRRIIFAMIAIMIFLLAAFAFAKLTRQGSNLHQNQAGTFQCSDGHKDTVPAIKYGPHGEHQDHFPCIGHGGVQRMTESAQPPPAK